jgi:hypothetical protein
MNRPQRKKLLIFNIANKIIDSIYLTDIFFFEYYSYLAKYNLPYSVEDLVSFYFIKEGWSVNRCYLQRKGILDLTIQKENNIIDVEVKSETDGIKLNQMLHCFTNKSLIVWVLPDETDIIDITYKVPNNETN